MSVKSAERVLHIFELLMKHSSGLTVKEISDRLAFPQSSTFNLVQTLKSGGYLRQDSFKQYKLGPKLIPIGTSAMESLDLYTEGMPHLSFLMEAVQETVFMAVLSEDELVYIAKVDSDRSIHTSAQPGKRKPLYCTGLGKSFLAFLPKKESIALLNPIQMKPITQNTITDRAVLQEQLNRFREWGYCVDDEENEEGLLCLAAPVFGPNQRIQAAISVAGPKQRMIPRKHAITEKLRETARQVSESIGGYQ